MRPLLVVVGYELAEDRQQVVFVEDYQVVEALSTKCPDHSFRDGICLWRVNRGGDRVDPNAPGALTEVAAIDGISITQQMARLLAPGVASMTCRQTQAAVGLAVMLTCTSSRRP